MAACTSPWLEHPGGAIHSSSMRGPSSARANVDEASTNAPTTNRIERARTATVMSSLGHVAPTTRASRRRALIHPELSTWLLDKQAHAEELTRPVWRP